jgi:hypothetical protein
MKRRKNKIGQIEIETGYLYVYTSIVEINFESKKINQIKHIIMDAS